MIFEASLDVAVRLVVGTVAGGVIGFQRARQGKPVGIRTLGLIGLGAALAAVLGALPVHGLAVDISAPGRILQGILTGVGFVGAGVILHGRDNAYVHGLTTAAAIWFAAILGAAAGLGAVFPVLVATVIGFVLLSLPEDSVP
jgi:putative Mg2+ transporter-C (MgtC) family protein